MSLKLLPDHRYCIIDTSGNVQATITFTIEAEEKPSIALQRTLKELFSTYDAIRHKLRYDQTTSRLVTKDQTLKLGEEEREYKHDRNISLFIVEYDPRTPKKINRIFYDEQKINRIFYDEKQMSLQTYLQHQSAYNNATLIGVNIEKIYAESRSTDIPKDPVLIINPSPSPTEPEADSAPNTKNHLTKEENQFIQDGLLILDLLTRRQRRLRIFTSDHTENTRYKTEGKLVARLLNIYKANPTAENDERYTKAVFKLQTIKTASLTSEEDKMLADHLGAAYPNVEAYLSSVHEFLSLVDFKLLSDKEKTLVLDFHNAVHEVEKGRINPYGTTEVPPVNPPSSSSSSSSSKPKENKDHNDEPSSERYPKRVRYTPKK